MENPNQLPQKLDPKEERKNVEFIGKNMIIRKCLLQMPEPKLRILSTLYGISDGRKVQRHRPVRTLHKIHWSSTAVQLLSTRSFKIHSIPWFFSPQDLRGRQYPSLSTIHSDFQCNVFKNCTYPWSKHNYFNRHKSTFSQIVTRWKKRRIISTSSQLPTRIFCASRNYLM